MKNIIIEELEIEEYLILPESVIYVEDMVTQKQKFNAWKEHMIASDYDSAIYFSGYSTSDLNSDHEDFWNIIYSVNEEFEIEISDKKLEEIETVQNLYDVIISCLKDQA